MAIQRGQNVFLWSTENDTNDRRLDAFGFASFEASEKEWKKRIQIRVWKEKEPEVQVTWPWQVVGGRMEKGNDVGVEWVRKRSSKRISSGKVFWDSWNTSSQQATGKRKIQKERMHFGDGSCG
jgi:hypothetical protein